MAGGVIVPRGHSTYMAFDESARVTKDATLTSHHNSGTATYMMWREEHLWNVSVLQRVHLSSLSWCHDGQLLLRKPAWQYGTSSTQFILQASIQQTNWKNLHNALDE
jgi:hypothetical protein